LIREAKVAQMYSTMQTGSAVGMQTLDACLSELVRRRRINLDAARAAAKTPENFH
jgi:twitching motility protein PilT